MGLFGKKQVSNVNEAAEVVASLLSKMGMDPTPDGSQSDMYLWKLSKGSAVVYIGVLNTEEFCKLHLFSPINYMPKENLLPFYRRCLELNHSLTGCALSINKDYISVTSSRPVYGLDEIELDNTLQLVANAADALDDLLEEEFDAKMYSKVA